VRVLARFITYRIHVSRPSATTVLAYYSMLHTPLTKIKFVSSQLTITYRCRKLKLLTLRVLERGRQNYQLAHPMFVW